MPPAGVSIEKEGYDAGKYLVAREMSRQASIRFDSYNVEYNIPPLDTVAIFNDCNKMFRSIIGGNSQSVRQVTGRLKFDMSKLTYNRDVFASA